MKKSSVVIVLSLLVLSTVSTSSYSRSRGKSRHKSYSHSSYTHKTYSQDTHKTYSQGTHKTYSQDTHKTYSQDTHKTYSQDTHKLPVVSIKETERYWSILSGLPPLTSTNYSNIKEKKTTFKDEAECIVARDIEIDKINGKLRNNIIGYKVDNNIETRIRCNQISDANTPARVLLYQTAKLLIIDDVTVSDTKSHKLEQQEHDKKILQADQGVTPELTHVTSSNASINTDLTPGPITLNFNNMSSTELKALEQLRNKK